MKKQNNKKTIIHGLIIELEDGFHAIEFENICYRDEMFEAFNAENLAVYKCKITVSENSRKIVTDCGNLCSEHCISKRLEKEGIAKWEKIVKNK